MGHVPLLDELAVVAALAVAVTVILSKFKLPTVAGLLAAGALLGPYGVRLATSVHAIEVLAVVGVVLLLFSIGLEFSLTPRIVLTTDAEYLWARAQPGRDFVDFDRIDLSGFGGNVGISLRL